MIIETESHELWVRFAGRVIQRFMIRRSALFAFVEVDPRPVGLQAVVDALRKAIIRELGYRFYFRHSGRARAHKKTRAAARTTSPAAVPSHTGLPLEVPPTLAGGLVVLLSSLKVSIANARSDAELHGDHLDPWATR